jgi:lysyl-tRNA synthetase class 2
MGEMKDIFAERRDKLNRLKAAKARPYGGRYENTVSAESVRGDFNEGETVRLTGRVMALRLHGKSVFADIQDRTGRLQFYLKKNLVGEEEFNLFVDNIDIGDIIGLEGETFKTKTGEPTVLVKAYCFLSKSLKPLPEKWHGLKDIEARYRHRYLDLTVNEKSRRVFATRVSMINFIREFLNGLGFTEVETPMMHPIAGGAAGKPFQTYHESLRAKLFLRIAPELYLKKLLVGGMEKVYEINRSFRNEGISPRHNPEFTMLEVYQAYSDYDGMMQLTRELITGLADKILMTEQFDYQGRTVDLSKWETVSFAGMMKDKFDISPDEDAGTWIKKLKNKGADISAKDGRLPRNQLLHLIADLIEPVNERGFPVFVTDLFSELCPLAKRKDDNPLLSERFELFIAGMEVANAYSELNDPLEQKERFTEQVKEDPEKKIDESFVEALEYGMPPAGGLGIGVDRLAMLFTDSASIRDVILFPQLKTQEEKEARR